MLGIIVVDHGSRMPAANAESEQLCDMIRFLRPEARVFLAHLEFLGPSIGDTVDDCIRSGATELVVLPYFLGSGRHAVEDVPRLAREAVAKHGAVKITLGRALGPNQAMAEILLKNAGL